MKNEKYKMKNEKYKIQNTKFILFYSSQELELKILVLGPLM